MSTHDIYGREYARMSQLKVGDKLECDGGFTCIPDKAIREVKMNNHGLYIDCEEEGHQLDGQLADDNDHLIGLFLAHS